MMSLLPPCPPLTDRVRALLGVRRNLYARRPSRIAYCGQIDCNKFEARVAPAWQPMFERSDNVMPVAAESAMIAVMEHDDVAVRGAWTTDAREPCDQTLGRLRLPVPTNF